MSQDKDIKIAELTKENEALCEQIAEMKKMLISADKALCEHEEFLIKLKSDIITLKSDLSLAQRRLRRFDKVLTKTWYGKLIKLAYRFLRKVKRIVLHK